MRLLIIDTEDLLEKYQRSESIFDFYPNGLKGLIANHFVNCMKATVYNPGPNPIDFFDEVLDLYHESPEYRLHCVLPEHIDQGPLLFIILLEIDRLVRQVVGVNRHQLQRAVIDIDTMRWGTGYVALEIAS